LAFLEEPAVGKAATGFLLEIGIFFSYYAVVQELRVVGGGYFPRLSQSLIIVGVNAVQNALVRCPPELACSRMCLIPQAV
jgi:hypothetical protein